MVGRILIADDVATNRIVLKVKLMAACYDVIQASGGTEALELARSENPDLILLDLMMPDMDGVAVCKALKNDPRTAHIPIIMVTAHDDDASKLSALRVGVDEFMPKPLDEVTLLARVRSLLRARDTNEELCLRDSTCRDIGFSEKASSFDPPSTIAMISAQTETAKEWRNALGGKIHDEIIIVPKAKALSTTGNGQAPDIYVIASHLAESDEGLRLISELRSRPQSRHSAIIMVIPRSDRSILATALDLGANDLMFEGFSPEEMALRIKTQIKYKNQADRLRKTMRDGLRMAVIDPLTGLYNRRYAEPHLLRVAERAKITGRPFAVMVLDLDRFKKINDTHGHNAGDAVLKEVADRVKYNLRGVDMVARIGGEEFLVIMPDTQLEQARMAAERLCRVVRKTPVVYADKQIEIPVSLSIGVAMGGLRDDVQGVEQLIEYADRALYASKSEGRNQVTISRSAA